MRRSFLPALLGVLISFATIFDLGAARRWDLVRQVVFPLVQSQDLAYTGAFRVPAKVSGQTDAQSLAYGGDPIAYWPAHHSLLITGFETATKTAEITIPTPVIAPTLAGLPRATFLQPLTDLYGGKRMTIDGAIGSGVRVGGYLPWNGNILITEYAYYDGSGTQTKSHFITGQDFANLGTVQGPFVVSTPFRNPGAGFVSGWMADVPTEWQPALGCAVVTGNGALAIVSRTSYGPSLSCFDPNQLGVVSPVPSVRLVGYPQAHPTLGNYGPVGNTAFFNGNMEIGGVIFPPGTSSVLFIGRRGSRFCYGSGTSNPALDLQPDPNNPGVIYCYDPTNASKGTHGYPYEQFVAAYDVNDLVQARQGIVQPWAVVPYATWTFELPFQTGSKLIHGATYDPETRRVFVSAGKQDGNLPVIHVFTLALTPPAPAPTAVVTAATTCQIQPSADPPDASGGWTVTYTLDGHPLPTSVTVGKYALIAKWTKGSWMSASPPTMVRCP